MKSKFNALSELMVARVQGLRGGSVYAGRFVSSNNSIVGFTATGKIVVSGYCLERGRSRSDRTFLFTDLTTHSMTTVAHALMRLGNLGDGVYGALLDHIKAVRAMQNRKQEEHEFVRAGKNLGIPGDVLQRVAESARTS
jgi:hypothetical protein